MFKQIKEIFWSDDRWSDTPSIGEKLNIPIYSESIHHCDAEDYYCAICKKGFKTKGARNSHRSLKHKNA